MNLIRYCYCWPMLGLVFGCNSHSNDWVLKSYDEKTGYVFIKNEVDYQTTCVSTGYPVLGTDNHPDLNPDAVGPDLAHGEADCATILPYLHKTVPSLRLLDGTPIIVFTGDKNYRLEFVIKHANSK